MLEKLKQDVCQANIELKRQKLVLYSFGNVSGFDPERQVMAIKPSGVSYDELTPDMIVLLDLKGTLVEGALRPSSDTPTHLELYRNYPQLGGICHTHSPQATMWAQACREIPCLGTTHADYFYGSVPVTDALTDEDIKNDYELNTGRVIVRRFKGINPLEKPAVLVAHHGPFTWGKSPMAAVEVATILEQLAQTAKGTLQLNPGISGIAQTLLDKHYLRKHGTNAYYGQK